MKYLFLFSILLSIYSCQNSSTAVISIPASKEEITVDTCISVKQETEFTLGFRLNMTQKEYDQNISKLIRDSLLRHDSTVQVVIPQPNSDITENLILNPIFDGCYLRKIELTGINNITSIKEILVHKYGKPKTFHTHRDSVGFIFWSNPILNTPYDSPNNTDVSENNAITEFNTNTIKGNAEPWQWPERYQWITSELIITLEESSVLYESLLEKKKNQEKTLQQEKELKNEKMKKVQEASEKL